MWEFISCYTRRSKSGFSSSSTAEEVTHGINGTGLTAIVTGASSGIGAETTRVLALRGVHVIMADKNVGGGREVREKILEQSPSAKIDIMELDLSSLASVRKFASEYNSYNLPLNILINNAGILSPPFTLSQDNIELQFATNYLGHFLLTNLLLDTMKNTVVESGIEGRIVNVTSMAHQFTYREGILFDKLNDQSRYSGFTAYGHSKLAKILHANELARQFKDDGVKITINSVHPGLIKTNILQLPKNVDRFIPHRLLHFLFLKDIPQGAATTCYVALHPQVKGVSGKYFSDCNIARPSKQAQDVILARKLLDFSMKLVE